MNVSLWAWTYEQEWIFLEYFDDMEKILKISLCPVRRMWKIFFFMYMDGGHKMDENYDRLKCMDGTNSKTIMLD